MRLPVALLCAAAPVAALVMTTNSALSEPPAAAPKRPEVRPLASRPDTRAPRAPAGRIRPVLIARADARP